MSRGRKPRSKRSRPESMKANTWIALLAYEARDRHAVECRRNDETARWLAAVRSRVFAELRSAIALDIERFLRAGGDRFGAGLTCHHGRSAQAFVVSQTDDSGGAQSLAVDLQGDSLRCRYDQRGPQLDRASAERGISIAIGTDNAALSWWQGGLVRRFATVDALSAFLLAPIFTAAWPDAPVRLQLEDH